MNGYEKLGLVLMAVAAIVFVTGPTPRPIAILAGFAGLVSYLDGQRQQRRRRHDGAA